MANGTVALILQFTATNDFYRLRYVIAGAEKLREQIEAAFQEKFALPILEGYGCTELAPVVSVNIPNVGFGKEAQIGNKSGTVGHPIPGVSVKVVHPDTFEPLRCGEEGLLLVKGPNVMLGYLNQPALTEEAIRDGWYVTGDIALPAVVEQALYGIAQVGMAAAMASSTSATEL